jgi:hypothetical protein
VHEEPANGVHPEAAGLVLAAVDAASLSDGTSPLPLVGELGRVVENHDRALGHDKAVARRLEMATEDLRVADPLVGEEPVGCLRVRPVLTRQRNALAHRARHLVEQRAQPPA